MSIVVLVPQDFLQWTFAGIGLTFGRVFGKKLDYNIQQSEWFGRRHEANQWIIKRGLDFLHHWWMGALLMNYFSQPEIYWFGWGLLVDDIPDLPARLKKMINW